MEKNTYENIDEILQTSRKGSNIYSKIIRDTEKMVIEKTLERSFGNQSIAAKILGITRNTLRAKIKKFSIEVEKYKI